MDNSFLSGKSNWKIAVLFAIFLPLFNIVINSQHRIETNDGRMFLTGSVTFLFLLIAWVVNSWLTNFFIKKSGSKKLLRKAAIVLLTNGFLLSPVCSCRDFCAERIWRRRPEKYLFALAHCL